MSTRTPRPRTLRLALIASTAGALALTACSGGGGFDSGSGGGQTQAAAKGPVTITFMITSNGPADVKLQQDVVSGWEKKTGNKVNVVAASDINQQLTQGFAAGSPPDLFFTDANVFPTYAKAGNLVAYGDQVTAKDDFYPGLVKTFTYDGKFYCAPKDSSNLALVVNTDMWKAAGLTDADVPKTWADLETVAKKLTQGDRKGLVIGDTR
ncbi:ABC transporter substrate-binding protein, partial [Lapillicoccus jejuensis]